MCQQPEPVQSEMNRCCVVALGSNLGVDRTTTIHAALCLLRELGGGTCRLADIAAYDTAPEYMYVTEQPCFLNAARSPARHSRRATRAAGP